MASWYNTGWKNRYPICVEVLGGGGGSYAYDLEISIPASWDLFWDNIRSDFFDVIVSAAEGDRLLTFKRTGADYANRTLTIQIDNHTVGDNNASNLIWLYFNNSSQSSDLAGSFTASSVKYGLIFTGAPQARVVTRATGSASSDLPQAAFTKTNNEIVDVWFALAGLFENRFDPYNKRAGLEGLSYVQVESLNSSGVDSALRYDETETRFVPGFVRVRTKAGDNGNDYTLVCNITTTLGQLYSLRCLVQVRNLLPN